MVEREFGVVDKGDADRALIVGLQHITLVDRIAFVQLDSRAVGARREDAAFGGVDGADRLVALTHQRGVAFATAEDVGTGQRFGHVRHDLAAALGHQDRRHFGAEEILHHDLLAVLTGEL